MILIYLNFNHTIIHQLVSMNLYFIFFLLLLLLLASYSLRLVTHQTHFFTHYIQSKNFQAFFLELINLMVVLHPLLKHTKNPISFPFSSEIQLFIHSNPEYSCVMSFRLLSMIKEFKFLLNATSFMLLLTLCKILTSISTSSTHGVSLSCLDAVEMPLKRNLNLILIQTFKPSYVLRYKKNLQTYTISQTGFKQRTSSKIPKVKKEKTI